MLQQQKTEMKQMLICGLDYSGKTTFIKNYCNDLNQYVLNNRTAQQRAAEAAAKGQGGQRESDSPMMNCEMFTTTPYINIEKIMMSDSQIPWIVYDMSG